MDRTLSSKLDANLALTSQKEIICLQQRLESLVNSRSHTITPKAGQVLSRDGPSARAISQYGVSSELGRALLPTAAEGRARQHRP